MADLLAYGHGSDGREYSVVALEWTLDKVQAYWDNIKGFNIFPDEVPKTEEGFLQMILSAIPHTLWFEVADDADKVIGLMYISNITLGVADQPTSAKWHAMLWDGKAGPRRKVLRLAIRELFRQFNLHRLETEIPLHFGGVIRAAKKIGFVEEGRKRDATLYKGIWYDVLLLSVLRDEVIRWEE